MDLGENYVMWNQNYEFNYDNIPKKYPIINVPGPRKKINRKRN